MQKIVYLLGAGATQAEADFLGIESNIIGMGINERIADLSKQGNGSYYNLLQQFGIPPIQDVESIISLFEGFVDRDRSFEAIYRELRELYRRYLIEHVNRKNISPSLLTVLLYLDSKFGEFMGRNGERISGILTTNYDSLAERAFVEVCGGIRYGFKFKTANFEIMKSIPFLLKLHGSFNWKIQAGKLEVSQKFEKLTYRDDYSGWIPPSVYKKPSQSEKIFSLIWERASKLLIDCDILRVVGSSLRNEDWALISLIFTSQIKSKKVFDIELIVPNEVATGTESENPYAIMQRLRFLGKLKNFNTLPIIERDDIIGDNIFKYWLDKKIAEIEQKNTDIAKDILINKILWGGK